MDDLGLVLGFAVLAPTSATAIYLLVSFALMWRHVPARSGFESARELFREALWVVVTQPLLPIFYVLGRRMADGAGTPIVFVHGYFQNRVDFLYLARELAKRRLGPAYGFNYFCWSDVDTITDRLARFVDGVLEETGAREVDLVCHSMGGLVAARYLVRGGRSAVRRCVTIATPHKGIRYRGPILGRAAAVLRKGHGLEILPDVPWLSVYSTHDNVVFPAEVAQHHGPLATNVAVQGVAHLAILFSRETAAAVGRFLGETSPPRSEVVVAD